MNEFGAIGFDDNDTPTPFSSGDLNGVSGASRLNSANAELARDLINNLTGFVGEVFQNYNVRDLSSGFVPFFPERRTFQNNELDWFINNQWFIKPNLTITMGLRWEYASVPNETNGLALAPESFDSVFGISGSRGLFNPGTFAGQPCDSLGALPVSNTTANARSFIRDCATAHVGATATNGRPLWNDDYNNFAPVLSIAWDPTGKGKTSIRAGFRISYIQDSFSIVGLNLDDNEGLEVRQSCTVEDGTCLANPMLLRNVAGGGPPIPAAPDFQLPAIRTILDNPTIDFRTYDPNLGTARYDEWNLSISHEIARNWAFEARYVGNRGVGLRRGADYNEINVDAVDPVTGQSFVNAFQIAQSNLACNGGSRFDDATGNACITANPLMAALIGGEPARLRSRSGLITALERNQTGQFVHRLTQVETSRPRARQRTDSRRVVLGAGARRPLPGKLLHGEPVCCEFAGVD